jgi:tetratricopeptide (TPR) repeat protein
LRLRDPLSRAAVLVTVLAAVFTVGGAARWALAIIAVPAVIGVLLQLSSRRGFERVPPLLAMLSLALALTAIQIIPWPRAVLSALNPTGAQLVDAGRDTLQQPALAWAPLSLDPAMTWRELFKLAIYVAVAWSTLRLVASSRGRFLAIAGVAAVAGLAALVGGVHEVLGLTSLYGLYLPHEATPTIMGPLLNPNTFASLLVVGSLLSAGLALHGPQPSWHRVAWAGNSAGTLAVALLTLSRGAAVAVVAGGLAMVFLLLRQGRERKPGAAGESLRVTVPAVVVMICAFTLVVTLSGTQVTEQLADTDAGEWSDPLSKYAAWSSATTLIEESPWIGTGRGAFEAPFTRVHPPSGLGTFSHLENEYLQAVVDWGIPGSIGLGLLLVWWAVRVLRHRHEGPLIAGAIGALVAVAVHSVVDFGLQMPGFAIPIIVVAAAVSYQPVQEQARSRRTLWLRLSMMAAIVVSAVLVLPAWGQTLVEDRRQLRARATPSYPMAIDAMRRHPLDYFAAGQAARALLRANDPRAATFLARAVSLHPTHGDLQRLLARELARSGDLDGAAQALTTALQWKRRPTQVVKDVTRYFSSEQAVAILATARHKHEFVVRELQLLGRPELALGVVHRLFQDAPSDLHRAEWLERIALEQRRLDLAEVAARRRVELSPTLLSRYALAGVLRRQGRLVDAEIELEKIDFTIAPVRHVENAWLLRCDVRLEQGKWAAARTCLRDLLQSPALSKQHVPEVERRLDRVERELAATVPR